MSVPNELRANFDVSFVVENVASLLPSGSYTPKFVLGGPASLVQNGTVDGDDVSFSLDASVTVNLATGQYWYQVVGEASPTNRVLLDEGQIWVRGKITGTGVYDGRTTAKIILDAIDAVIASKATADQQSYVIQSGGSSRSLSRLSMEDLMRARGVYSKLVAAENRAANQEPLFKQHTLSPSRVL